MRLSRKNYSKYKVNKIQIETLTIVAVKKRLTTSWIRHLVQILQNIQKRPKTYNLKINKYIFP